MITNYTCLFNFNNSCVLGRVLCKHLVCFCLQENHEVLRYLSKSTKCSPPVSRFKNLLKLEPILSLPTENLTTKPNKTTPNSTSIDNDEWRIIYRLPMIRLASAFNRVKVPYGIFNGIVLPTSFTLEQSSLLPPSTALIITVIGVSSWLTLAICSLFLRNLIGIVYVNDNNDLLKLAYIDYWGKRNDVCVELDDLVLESEKRKPSTFDFYISFCLYSDDKVKYRLLQRFGNIEDPATFVSIFGE